MVQNPLRLDGVVRISSHHFAREVPRSRQIVEQRVGKNVLLAVKVLRDRSERREGQR
jgi:hypothetical protein